MAKTLNRLKKNGDFHDFLVFLFFHMKVDDLFLKIGIFINKMVGLHDQELIWNKTCGFVF